MNTINSEQIQNKHFHDPLMRKNVRRTAAKIVFLLILIFTVSLSAVNIYSKDITAVKSDITAFVNDIPIKSYNIDGNTYIIAEDLSGYGFQVYMQPHDNRFLNISYTYGGTFIISGIIHYTIPPYYDPDADKTPVGTEYRITENTVTACFPYIEGGQYDLNTYNLDGFTLMRFDDLEKFGYVTWNPDEREIRFTEARSWSITDGEAEPTEEEFRQKAESMYFEAVRGDDGEFVIMSENANRATSFGISCSKSGGFSCGFSFVGTKASSAPDYYSILGSAVNRRYDGVLVTETTDYANEHILLYINGEKKDVTWVNSTAGNGHREFSIRFDGEYIPFEDVQSVIFRIE